MKFKSDPIERVNEDLFSCKTCFPVHLQLASMSKVNEHKHMGLVPQADVSFGRHFYEKMMKAKKIIDIKILPF